MSKYNFNEDKYLSNSFICYRWMNVLCQEYKVSEGAKNLYALIFAFTKDGKHEFIATQQYVSDMLYCSVSSVKRYTKELINANLIDKGYTKVYDSSRVKLKLNSEVVKDFFGYNIEDLYTVIRNENGEVIKNISPIHTEAQKNDNTAETLIMDINISKKNGVLHSSEKRKKEKKERKENKYTQFMDCMYNSNYPDAVISAGEQYVKWLLGNRKVELAQWKVTIQNLNSELKLLNSKQIREEAAVDAFNRAFSGGYQKVYIDRYKYGKYMTLQQPTQYDNQKCDSKVEEVTTGVYQVISNCNMDFVKDENGKILTF